MLGPKYLTHVSPYDVVLHLKIDKINYETLQDHMVWHVKRQHP